MIDETQIAEVCGVRGIDRDERVLAFQWGDRVILETRDMVRTVAKVGLTPEAAHRLARRLHQIANRIQRAAQ